MNNEATQQLLDALQWRYATKVFDATKKIPADVWQTLEQALVLTPSSYGLQPYRFLVINDPAKRAELLPHSWNQKQVVDASHFVVFTARTKMTGADVAKLIQRTSDIRKIPAESLNFYRDLMLGDIVNGSRGKTAHEWATRQTYIALGNLSDGRPRPLRIRSCAGFELQRLRDGGGLRAGLSRRQRQIREPAQGAV